MKKNRSSSASAKQMSFKTHLVAKLIFLLVAGLACVPFPSCYAQEKRIDFRSDRQPAETVIERLKEMTSYRFLYNHEEVRALPAPKIDLKNATVREILSALLGGSRLDFKIEDNVIIISPKLKEAGKEQSVASPRMVTLSGTVRDSQNQPLPGATVSVAGTPLGVATGIDGSFTLSLPDNREVTLVFSFIGMKSQHRTFDCKKDNPAIHIMLEEEQTEMDEVIVTGYQNIKKENATGSYQVITDKELERRYSTDIISSLEGMLPGLVSYNNGLNGDAESKIMIRGVSTFTTMTRPLVVVDGLPIESSIETINPADIASITVLKDAAAASIYGARASNGVIVVQTKRAKADRVEVNFSMDLTTSALQKYDNFGYATAEEQIEMDERIYEETIKDPMYSQYLPMYQAMYPSSISPMFSLLLDRDAGKLSASEYDERIARMKKNDYLKEWSDAVLKNKFLQQYNLAFRVKGSRLSSNLNLNFKHSNEGIVNERSQVLNFSYRGEITAAKWLDIAVGFNMNSNRQKKHADQLGYLLTPTNQAAYHSIYDENGDRAYYMMACSLDEASLQNPALGLKSEAYNLLDELDKNYTRTRNTNLRSFVHATFKTLPSLKVSGMFQYEDISNKSETYLEKESYDMRHIYNLFTSGGVHYCPDGGILSMSNVTGDYYTFRAQADFSKVFGEKHSVDAIVGTEIRETNLRSLNNKILGYDDATQTNMQNQVNLNKARTLASSDLGPSFANPWMRYSLAGGWGTSSVRHRYTSVYFTGNYMYDRRYSASVSVRVDKTDLFGADPKYRGRPLWSVGLGWNINEENFMKTAEWVNALKLRASYGLTGNIDQSTSSFLTARIYNNTIVDNTKSASIQTPPNDKLRWEKTASYNVGVDYMLFGNRLSGSLDGYYKYSSDLLSKTDLDPSCGFGSLTINNGEAVNKGVELGVRGVVLQPKRKGGFGINAVLNLAYNKNEIKKLTYEMRYGIEMIGWGSNSHVLQKGRPVNALYAWRFAQYRMDEEMGMYEMLWYKADGSTSNMDLYGGLEPEDVIFAGGLDPKFTGSFAPEFTWKGFTLSAMFAYYGGHYMRANASAWQSNLSFLGSGRGLAQASCLDWWRNPDSEDAQPQGGSAMMLSINGQGMPMVDKCVFPADFLKLRNIVLSYEIPSGLCRKCRVASARLRFQANNVATWVKNSLGIDPEANNAWTGYAQLKTPRSYTVSLNINF